LLREPSSHKIFQLVFELELYCLLNEPSPNRQYPLRIGSFTPLVLIKR